MPVTEVEDGKTPFSERVRSCGSWPCHRLLVADAAPGAADPAAPVIPSGVAATTPATASPALEPLKNVIYVFFTPDEAPVIEALVNRLVPADHLTPSGVDIGLALFLDRQLAGAYGQGAKQYLSGPWAEGTPNQGYQLPFSPAELYRQSLAELAVAVDAAFPGKALIAMSAAEQDAVLTGLEAGTFRLRSVPSKLFFETLRLNVIEGMFSDPVYGGNRGMTGWKLLGFPGVQIDWTEGFKTYRDKLVDLAPKSMADNL